MHIVSIRFSGKLYKLYVTDRIDESIWYIYVVINLDCANEMDFLTLILCSILCKMPYF